MSTPTEVILQPLPEQKHISQQQPLPPWSSSWTRYVPAPPNLGYGAIERDMPPLKKKRRELVTEDNQ